MADQTTVLQLVLNELGVGNDISSQDDRIAIQKLICLVQEAGLQLGYSFNWYVRGPYSPSLTGDYYQIAANSGPVEADAQNYVLSEPAQDAVRRVTVLMNAPDGVDLPRVFWLELTASVAFLLKRFRFSKEAAKQKIEKSKPYLLPHFETAYTRLEQTGFLE